MASLAQQKEPVWIQILVVRSELVVNIQVLNTRVMLTAELTGLVPGRQHILSEDKPLRGESESLVLRFEFVVVFLSFHTYQ